MKIVVLFAFYLISIQVAYSQIRINEVCSSNSESLYDEDNETPDWIELYNYSDNPVNLSNWSISDQNNQNNAWQLPDTTIQPGQFFLIYASGKGRYTSGYYAMHMKSRNSITNFDYHEEYRYRYKEIIGDFRSTLEIKSMNNENLWAVAGIKIQDTLSNISTFFSTFATAKEKGGHFAFKRDTKADYPSWIPLYGIVNLPYSKIGLDRKGDSLYTYYYNRLGEIYKKVTYPNFLPEKIYWGVSVSSENPDIYGQFVINNLVLDGDTIDINTLDVHEETTSEAGYDYNYNECHSDFSIKGGETIYLYSESNIVDSVETSETASDITHVYYEGEWGITDDPTPGFANTSIYLGRVPKPLIEYENGVVTIESKEDTDVYYTLDGSLPIKSSEKYVSELYLEDDSKLITAIATKKESLNSFPVFKTNKSDFENKGFPIVTLSADSVDLWGQYGLFSDFAKNIDLKIDSRIEIITSDKIINENVNIKIHGNTSRLLPQKSFRVYADNKKGKGYIENKYFKDTDVSIYDQIVVRNGGTDWKELHLRDAFASILAKRIKGQISASYQPSLAFLNDEFYGLLNLRERIDDDYISELFEVDDDNINYYEDNGHFIKGDFWAYNKYKEFVILNDFTSQNSYIVIDSIIDIENFIGYTSLEIFGVNHDWPWKNVKIVQVPQIDNRFRYIVHDMDWSFGLNNFSPWDNKLKLILDESNDDFSNIFKSLLTNNQFKIEFINRYCDLMNTVFLPENLNQLLDSLANNIRPIIPLQQELWPESVVNWEDELLEMKRFINERPYYAIRYLDNELNNTSGIALLNLTSFPSNAGSFRVNTLTIDESQWSGKYLQNVPVTITAVPKIGYKFKKWNIDSLGSSASITTTLAETMNIEAIYEELDPTADTVLIVINEIMYNADKDKDTKDWVELYNAGKISVNLNGWSMIDEDDTHTPFVIGNDVIIEPNEYIIFTRNKNDFEALINIENQVIGDFDYGFGGNDIVILKDAQGNTHDSVNYDNDLPWPEGADGTGYTIELINPFLDNNIAGNWEISQPELGTPGLINSVYDDSITGIKTESGNSAIDFIDKKLTVRSDIGIAKIRLFDISGKMLNIDFTINYNIAEADLNVVNKGLYLLSIVYESGREETVKLIVN